MRNPLRPVRLGLLWLLAGIPLENHTAAIQRIDEGHQEQMTRLRRPQFAQAIDSPAGNKGAASRYIVLVAREESPTRVALVAGNFDLGCDALVTGPGGILSYLQPDDDARWDPARGSLMMGNGSSFQVYGADKPNRLRGPQFHHAIAYDRPNWPAETAEEAWRNLKLAVRLAGPISDIVRSTGGPITDPTAYMPHVDAQAAVKAGMYGGPQ